MKKELTEDKKDWISWKNDIFKAGDILIIQKQVIHPSGKVLCAPGDHLIVMGADCIGCFVRNLTHPEMNFEVPANVPEHEAHLWDRWMIHCAKATHIRN